MQIKQYAKMNKTPVSKIVEEFLRNIDEPQKNLKH
ncbi:DUF6364 family protein [Chryseobacterium suipulveris]